MHFYTLKIKMFGDFSLEYNNKKVSDYDNRSKKVWILLAYLVYYRHKAIPKEEIINLLWHNEKKFSDTNNLLKAVFHRLRKFLENLDLTLSKELISLNKGYFKWNHDIPLELDIEEFENLCNSGLNTQNSSARLSFFLKAIEIYNGRFLSKINADFKLLSVSSFFHNLYVRISQQTILLLEHEKKYYDACVICKKGCELDPYNEFFYQHLMKNMVYTDSASDITSVYYNMERLFETSLGTKPSLESINIFHLATNKNDNKINSKDIFSAIEIKDIDGCFFCNYDTFQAIHRFIACSISRSNALAYIAVLSIKDIYGNYLSYHSLCSCNEQIESLLKTHLRKSDTVCRYNKSQYILLLLHGTQYNCSKALDRIIYLYKRSYPRSPAVLSYSLNEVNPII